jgi:hypothetical protein
MDKLKVLYGEELENAIEGDEGFRALIGVDDDAEDESTTINQRHYSIFGDFWRDYPDHVTVGNETLAFGILGNKYLIVPMDDDCGVLQEDFEAHIELIQRWHANKDTEFVRVDQPGPLGAPPADAYQSATEKIAYRGGVGYVYAQYITKAEAVRLGVA